MSLHPGRTGPLVAAAAAFILTACASTDLKSTPNEHIVGAGTDDPAKPPSPTAVDGEDHPEVSLPSDLNDVFVAWTSADETEESILTDVAHRIDATNYAITQGDRDSDVLSFYYRDGALADAKDWVDSLARDGYSITGVNRYFNLDPPRDTRPAGDEKRRGAC
ncbi:hypothetical protein [Streptomyces sp. WMMC905]|uniref:hypothetical protein n=1 Tax=Streptomyces sp. WMMC905 TaxID=3404123 RepID=UPI003B959810